MSEYSNHSLEALLKGSELCSSSIVCITTTVQWIRASVCVRRRRRRDAPCSSSDMEGEKRPAADGESGTGRMDDASAAGGPAGMAVHDLRMMKIQLMWNIK